MRIQIIDEKSLAIYIEPPELNRYEFDEDDEFLARIARDEFRRLGGSADVGELSLVAYSSGGGLLVFAERSGVRLERAVCVCSSLDDMLAAAASIGSSPRMSSLIFCEGGWYIELYDEHERVSAILAALCEFGRVSHAGAAWLREHGETVMQHSALETLRLLA